MSAEAMVGKRLDKYEVTRLLGAGGMGAVYEARHTATARRVAIKVIHGDITPDESLVVRFQREARAAGTIESRHIAQVLDAGKDAESGAPYLVMELLDGEDLDTLVKRSAPFAPALALRIVAQALAGLERAHAANVIHRDIKPANLFLARTDGGERVVKLVDFGIAKVRDDLASSREHALTQTSALLGSPLYMSPEQARASKSVDGRADLWSLGVVLYQMLSGRAPHADAESLTELLLAICTTQVAPIQDRAPWVSADVAAIVHRALASDPRQRFATAAEMREAIVALVPDWQRLDDAMLVPLDAETRATVAERAVLPGDGRTVTGPGDDALAATRIDGPAAARAISAPGSITHQGLSTTQGDAAAPRRRGWVGPAVAAVLASAAVLGAAAYLAPRASGGAAPAPSAGLVASPNVVAAPELPAATASAGGAASSAGPAPGGSGAVEPPPAEPPRPGPRPRPTATASTPAVAPSTAAAPRPTASTTRPAPRPPASSPISREFD